MQELVSLFLFLLFLKLSHLQPSYVELAGRSVEKNRMRYRNNVLFL